MRTYSLTTYRELLESALRFGWSFVGYQEHVAVTRPLLLRHDVDYSLDLAVEVARVNAELGISGTFFLLLRSNLYNLLAPRNLTLARTLSELGQRIGLHFAALDPVPDEGSSVIRQVQLEMSWLREALPNCDPVVAWHNPSRIWLERFGDLSLPGLINAYATQFSVDMCYRSDSNLRHSPTDLIQLVSDSDIRKLHLLIHPFNWAVGGRDMIDILAGTWQQVLREREEEFRLNRVYQATFPDGMPATCLKAFVQQWLDAARQAA